jgi:hypothetical protein
MVWSVAIVDAHETRAAFARVPGIDIAHQHAAQSHLLGTNWPSRPNDQLCSRPRWLRQASTRLPILVRPSNPIALPARTRGFEITGLLWV